MNLNKLILTITILISLSAKAQDKWDVSKSPTKSTQVSFTTTEGTWMNLDVSPDGKTIVFDLLGDIYALPISGGEAKLLRGGLPFEVQPRFNHKGDKIAFTSDAGGGDNIWTMDPDGKNAKQVTKEDFRLLNNAVFTQDDQYIIARKHFTSSRSLGAGELWMYHLTGGSGLQLTEKKNAQQDLGEPNTFENYVYFSEDVYPGGYFQYNKDPNQQIYVIKRYDRKTGEIEQVTGGPGGAFRPQVSPDGKLLAFVKRVREKSVLYLHDLKTGEEWPVYDNLSKDQQEAWAIFGVYTNFNWLPDNKNIIIWAQGKLQKVNIDSKTATEIPFSAKCDHKITNALNFRQEVSPKEFNVKVIRQAITSKDEKYLIFNAVGYLWKKELPNGTPVRLTNGNDFEFEPSFSPDGEKIIYVTWSDENAGSICSLKWRDASALPEVLTSEKAIYRMPVFHPNGQDFAYIKEDGNDHQGYAFCKKPGIYLKKVLFDFNADKTVREPIFLTADGEYPQFSKDGSTLYFQTGGYIFGANDKKLKSIKLDNKEIKTLATTKYGHRIVLSPDEKWFGFIELHKVYIAEFPTSGKEIELFAGSSSYPVTQVAKGSGINLHWSFDSQKLHWNEGDNYFTVNTKERFKHLSGKDTILPLDSVGIKINLTLKTDVPNQITAFTNANVITMKDSTVLQNVTVLIENNIIKNIGKDIKVPENATVVDLKGKYIMPGLIDVHAHLGTFRFGLSPQKQWSYYANLAFGVTTTHDPSSNSEMVFTQSEMVKCGNMIGPRIYSTGTILYGADGDFKAVINNINDARFALKRNKSYGAFSVKSYNQPRREQRQQVIQAADENKMMVVPEGGSTYFHNLSMILDGHTGIEHNLPIAVLHNDVIQLWSKSKTQYTPTLIVAYGAINGENYFYDKTNVWENEKLLTFTPRAIIDSKARHRTKIPDTEYENGHILISKSCKKLTDAGVKVNLGAHGQIQGIGAHWELWMLAQGGMSNFQALKCATINGADYIGMGDQIGTIEKGKIADLIVLEKNPLEDIRNSESVTLTMINGRLFDCKTMNEYGKTDKTRSRFYWENNKYSGAFHWHEDTHGFEDGGCVCGE